MPAFTRMQYNRSVVISAFNQYATKALQQMTFPRHIAVPTMNKNKHVHGVSIIIPTQDQAALLRQCINSLLEKTDHPLHALEIIIVNNQSKETETLDYLAELSSLEFVKVIDYDLPFNFSAMNNLAVRSASHDIICLLNNDIEVISSGWLTEMLRFLDRSDIGCVGAKLYYPDNTIQHAGVVLGINGVAGHVYKHSAGDAKGYDNHLNTARYYSAVTAACMLVKKSVYSAAGGFDEKLAVAYNDVAFCIRLGQLGYKHVWTPRAELYHHESVSRGTHKQRTRAQKRQFKKEVTYMKKKWGKQLMRDPSWNTNWPLTESWQGKLINQDTPTFIILATYNGVEHIAEQLDSLLSQTCACEIYIFDDCSTDGTVELIQEAYLHHDNLHLTLNDSRLGYVKNFEQGLLKTLNLGAQFFALCDQDDVWSPHRIQKMRAALSLNNHDTPTLAYSDLRMMNTEGKVIHPSYLKYRSYSAKRCRSSHSLAIALGQNGVMGNTILMNRALLEKALPFPNELHTHDYWLSLVAQLSGQCVFIPETLVSYRIHMGNSSNSLQALTDIPSRHPKQLLHRLLTRDYRLPYKEDSRDQVLRAMTDQFSTDYPDPASTPDKDKKLQMNGLLGSVSKKDIELVRGFLHYLDFDKPRWYLAYWMIKNNFIRNGWRHKLRFIYRIFVTARY